MNKFRLILVVMCLSGLISLSAETIDSEEASGPDFGFIFNTNNILLDMESYMGGVGMKFMYPDFSTRIMAGFGYQTSTVDLLSVSLGFGYERPFFRKMVTPYWGVISALEFENESDYVDENNWNNTMTLSGKIGGIVGAEVYLTDFLSLFCEYELSGNVAWARITENANGTIADPVDSVNWEFLTQIGNSGSIGVVIFVEPVECTPVIKIEE